MTPILVGLGLFVVGSLIAIAVTWKRRAVLFAEKFPLISDAEFLARCTPGTSPRWPSRCGGSSPTTWR